MKGKYFIGILVTVLIFLPLAPFSKENPKFFQTGNRPGQRSFYERILAAAGSYPRHTPE